MTSQRVSPNAIFALKEALLAAFWFKGDLRNYASAAVHGEPTFLAAIEWDAWPKRESVSLFVDRLVREQDQFPGLLVDVMLAVARLDDFSRLRRADDPETRIAEAKAAVARLSKLTEPFERDIVEKARVAEAAATTRKQAAQQVASRQRLAELRSRFIELSTSTDHQGRGRRLEALLRDLFDLFGLDPRAAFALAGEQIDGGFTFGGEYYIVEAKWTAEPTQPGDVSILRGKVRRRSENTLGLFVSISGFTDNAVMLEDRDGSPLIFMTGEDLYSILDARVTLPEALGYKRRIASMEGRVFAPLRDLLVRALSRVVRRLQDRYRA